MSILFVLLMFLLVMSISYFRSRGEIFAAARPEAVAKPQAPRMQRAYGFSLPEGYAFHPGHTWVPTEGSENARGGWTALRRICWTAGQAVTVMALYLCVQSLNVKLDTAVLGELSRVIARMLALYGIFRGVNLYTRGAVPYMFRWRQESLSFRLEIGLLVVVPLILPTRESVTRNPQRLYWTCSLVVMGFMANLLNVSITGLQASSGLYYVPKWTEFAATVMVLTAIVMAFRYPVIYLDILPKNALPRWLAKEGIA